MKIKSIKTKIILVILSCLTLCTLSVGFLIWQTFSENVRMIGEQTLLYSQETYNNIEANTIRTLSSTLEVIASNPQYQELFQKRDRAQLLLATEPVFATLKSKYGITNWNYLESEPKNSIFLRVNNPQKFGDVIRRASFLSAIKTKTLSVGKELGATAFALRAVIPCKNAAGALIGYVELGEEINHFISSMKQQTGNDYGLIFDKKYMVEKDWASSRVALKLPNNWNDSPNVVLAGLTSGDTDLVKYNGKIADIPENGTILDQIHQQGHVYLRGLLPMYDAQKQKVGGIFILRDVTTIYQAMMASLIKGIAVLLLIMLVLCRVILWQLKRLIFDRLDRVTEVTTAVVGGDYGREIPTVNEDEVGRLEMLLNQFRIVFVNVLEEFESLRSGKRN